MGVAVTSDDGVGLAGQTVSFSSESMDRRVVPLPHWPVSAAQEGLSTSTRPLRICPHEETTDANAVIAELLIGNRNPREAFAQLTLPEWFISMHVHGVNDYGRRPSDLDYEDRSEVTTFSRSGCGARVLFVGSPLWERGSGGDGWVRPSSGKN